MQYDPCLYKKREIWAQGECYYVATSQGSLRLTDNDQSLERGMEQILPLSHQEVANLPHTLIPCLLNYDRYSYMIDMI
jgi:hypothetical protein